MSASNAPHHAIVPFAQPGYNPSNMSFLIDKEAAAAGRTAHRSARESDSAEAQAPDDVCRIFARRRRCRPNRSRARGRRKRRFLHGAADAKGAHPGRVYGGPYGHLLMLVRRVPEMNGLRKCRAFAVAFWALSRKPCLPPGRRLVHRANVLYITGLDRRFMTQPDVGRALSRRQMTRH